MPFFVITFSGVFFLFMYCLPAKSGLIAKLILSIGLAAAGNLVFAILLPDLAMKTIFGS